MRRPADEEDPRRFAHLPDQRRIAGRVPVLDPELGGIDRDGKELGERAVALQRTAREAAVELRPVAGGGDDHQIGGMPDDAVPDLALVEAQHAADQDHRSPVRSRLRDTRSRPSEPQEREHQDQCTSCRSGRPGPSSGPRGHDVNVPDEGAQIPERAGTGADAGT